MGRNHKLARFEAQNILEAYRLVNRLADKSPQRFRKNIMINKLRKLTFDKLCQEKERITNKRNDGYIEIQIKRHNLSRMIHNIRVY